MNSGFSTETAEINTGAIEHSHGQPSDLGRIANFLGKPSKSNLSTNADGEPGGDDHPADVAREFCTSTDASNTHVEAGIGNGCVE
jgi:hypothetical protein